VDTSGRASTEHRIDERRVRFERAVVAIALLAGFVWHEDLVVVATTLVVAVPLLPHAPRPLGVLWDVTAGRRLGPPRRTVPDSQVHDGDLVLAIGLSVASLTVLAGLGVAGLGLVGRAVSLVIAMVAAAEAAAGAPVAAWTLGRVRRSR